jgi:hypothetical protein
MLLYYNTPEVDYGLLERLEIIGGYLYAVKTESNWDITTRTGYGISNIIIRNCKIHDSGRDCIKITPGCDNILIESCEIFNSGRRCTPTSCNAEGIDCVNGSNVVVRNCYIHHTGTNGLYLKGGARNGIIESNLITDCGTGGVLFGFKGTDYEWFETDVNPDLHGNINGIIRNNIIARTTDEGIGLYAAQDAKVYNNTIIDAAARYHSSFYISRGEVSVNSVKVYPYSENVDVRNNIFMNISTTSNPVCAFRVENGDPLSNLRGTNIIDYNIYYQEGGTNFDDDINGYTNLEQWKTNTGYDANSIDAYPNLDDNFHLTYTSINAIDKGAELSAVLEDYDGANRTVPYDIGADEYLAGEILVVPPADSILGTGGSVTSGGIATNINHSTNKNKIQVNIFPSSVTGNITLYVYSETDQKVKCYITNLSGKKILSFDFSLTGKTINQKQLLINELRSGIYFITLSFKKENVTKQFIKTE